MRKFLLTLGAVVSCAAIVVVAQTKINPTDPQPTCAMCPGYYIPVSELQAYTQKAIAEKLTDQQVRDVEIGKAHIGIGMVHRGKLDPEHLFLEQAVRQTSTQEAMRLARKLARRGEERAA